MVTKVGNDGWLQRLVMTVGYKRLGNDGWLQKVRLR